MASRRDPLLSARDPLAAVSGDAADRVTGMFQLGFMHGVGGVAIYAPFALRLAAAYPDAPLLLPVFPCSACARRPSGGLRCRFSSGRSSAV